MAGWFEVLFLLCVWGSGLGRLSIPTSDPWTAVPLFPWAHLKMRASSIFIRRRQWLPTPVLLPGNSHGWRSLVGCSLWGRTESDTTEAPSQQHLHWSRRCWEPHFAGCPPHPDLFPGPSVVLAAPPSSCLRLASTRSQEA